MYVNKEIISNYEIEYAEKILLGKGLKFDNERRLYIKNFETLDLHAVPGSGKTTLLLAKLLILEKKLPLENDQSILVISHTNTAVDEIKAKIEKYCPKLFSEPNFIGTIQSFVNTFLAIPYYESLTHKKIASIDDEFYNKEIEKFYNLTKNFKLKAWLNRKYDPIKFLQGIRYDDDFNLTSGINFSEKNFELSNKTSPSYIGLKDMKNTLFQKGVLHYDDAYTLAFRYIKKLPLIKEILQSKFKYIFVDEMQDMDIHQYKLLESIFYDDGNSKSTYQRIGDNNQAIYSTQVKSENVWENREKVLTINGSNRLTPLNAHLVSNFAIDGIKIDGLNSNYSKVKPTLYVYTEESCECQVIQRFTEDLNDIFGKHGVKNPIVKVIAWRKKSDSDHKIALNTYCPKSFEKDFSTAIAENKPLEIDFNDVFNMILNYMVLVFRENRIKLNNEVVTRNRLINYIKESYNYLDFQLRIYNWCVLLLRGNYTAISDINKYILEIDDSVMFEDLPQEEFLKKRESDSHKTDNSSISCEKCRVLGEKIYICSAHSVKGETHDATLFLESFYNRKYESEVLAKILNGKQVCELIKEKKCLIGELDKEIKELNGKRGTQTKTKQLQSAYAEIETIREYAKLVYVSLSRARGIVAYGISKERFDKYLKEEISDEWDVKFVN